MTDWGSYALQDFIPFTADVYVRLLERMSETFWPLHLLTLTLGTVSIALALTGRARLACLTHVPHWAFVGVAFFIQRYAELNWAGGYLGYAFIVQALLLSVIAVTRPGPTATPSLTNPPVLIGVVIAVAGLVGMPLIAPLAGDGWYQAEVFGIHADPTAVTTLGLVLILLRGWVLWVAGIIPVVWTLISALTLQVLDASGFQLLLAVAGIGLTGLVWKSCETDLRA
ncbi:hypothetical protein KEM63_06490 [Halopseudomonas nanhaiensis]|uniref:hypothetical protein n=1 Tax=Halopseudomonas nanhaiensis TaxID=2830842 RepID=UPI001CBF3699|nr:hypothetical protein [Halopseudomonas nanhaiensis]UAW99609.1 hypothetical protein KEM63_06490 [Halopseudomonas nanhaiensis]